MATTGTAPRAKPVGSELSRLDWEHIPFPRTVELSWHSGSEREVYRSLSEALTRSGFRILTPQHLPEIGWSELAALEVLGPLVGEAAPSRAKESGLRRWFGSAEALLIAGVVAATAVLDVYAISTRGPGSQDAAIATIVFAISALVLWSNRKRQTILVRISVSPDPPVLPRADGDSTGPRPVRVSFGALISRTELKPGFRIARELVQIDPLPAGASEVRAVLSQLQELAGRTIAEGRSAV